MRKMVSPFSHTPSLLFEKIFSECIMNMSSIRWRLPISYAGIALLAAVVLGSMMFLTLDNFYTQQELGYLTSSAELMGPGISKHLEDNPSSEALNLYVQNLSCLIQARVRLLDPAEGILADSGALQSQPGPQAWRNR